MKVTIEQALSWRLRRHHLLGGAAAVEDVVGRLAAVPAWSGDPDLAVRRRLGRSAPGEVARALHDGRLMKTYAFRGATHLMRPEDAGRYLALRAAGRMWELPSWIDHYRLTPQDWPDLRDVVRGVVADGPATREQLAARVAAHPRFRHLATAFNGGNDTFLKPFAWQGDLCFGPDRDGRATFQAPRANPRWGGIPDLEDAGRSAVMAYLDAYGPATPAHLHYWLGEGLGAGRKRIIRWLAESADDLAEVDIGGEPRLHAHEHLESLGDEKPEATVTLLPGHDQWVLGPGTSDRWVVPPQQRPPVTRGANLVLIGGAVAGTWKIRAGMLTITVLPGASPPPAGVLAPETERLATLLDHPLDVTVEAG